jgi:hypothetical protein
MSPNLSRIISDVSFWTCLVSVFLFAYSRFNVSLPDTDELAPPLKPRSFTVVFRFLHAAFIYLGVYGLTYFALLYAGSFPLFQNWLATLFGGLVDSSGQEAKVGTPAWAALVATAAVPAMPWLAKLDEAVRSKLHDLASIPRKAELIGFAILRAPGFPPAPKLPPNPPRALVTAAVTTHRARFARLSELWNDLQQIEDQRARARYEAFFRDNQSVLDALAADFAVDLSEPSGLHPKVFEDRLDAKVRKAARLTGCALIHAEAPESEIENRLSALGLATGKLGLDFRAAHLIVAFFALCLMTIVGCYVAALAYGATATTDATLFAILGEHSWRFLLWGAISDVVYLLPLLLAVGVAMYLVDRTLMNDASRSVERLAIHILTFAGAAGLALFILLGWSFVLLQVTASATTAADQPTVEIGRILPWVLPPALLATLFLSLSDRKPLASRTLDVLLDVTVCGGAAAAASALALAFTVAQGYGYAKLPPGFMWYLAPITAAMIGVTIGAIVCLTVRPPCAAIAALPSGLVAAAGAAGALAAALVPAGPLVAPVDVAIVAPAFAPAVAAIASPDDDTSG